MTIRISDLRNLLASISLALVLFGSLGSTAARADAPTATDFFNVGAFTEVMYCWYYNLDFQDQLKTKYASGRALYVKAGAPDALLKSFDAYENSVMTFPLAKNWSDWPQAQRDAFNALDIDETTLGTWLGADNTMPKFFYYLGIWTLDISYNQPTTLAKGYTFAQELGTFTKDVNSFAALKTTHPDMYKMLSPDCRKAFDAIAAYKDKANDPLSGGLVVGDVADMQTQANIINAAARAGTLVSQ